jgi:hypothetical protein
MSVPGIPPELLYAPLFPFAVIFGILGLVLIFAGIGSFLYLQFPKAVFRLIAGLVLLAFGGLASAVSVGMMGYRALTREEVAAYISVKPEGAKRFSATVRYPDGRQSTYQLSGDEIYVDAHILKWHPYANIVGLHTAYELDRIAGRYHDIKDERDAMRTVHALGRDKPIDLYGLRRSYSVLAPFLDAEYGSASYVPVTKPQEFELRVSTTGLLLRPATLTKP